MRLIGFSVLLWAVSFAYGDAHVAAPTPRAPSIAKLLRAELPHTRLHVERVLPDLGGGRFPVLFAVESKDCYSTFNEESGADEGETCEDLEEPHVAVARAGARGVLALEGEIALHDPGRHLEWGVTNVKDLDLDGKPDLEVVLAWSTREKHVLGAERHRHLCIVDLAGAPKLAFNTEIDVSSADGSTEHLVSRWKFVPAKDKRVPDLVITRRVGLSDAFNAGTEQKRVDVFVYDPAKHYWLQARATP
jgi:hypothetical protein